jgi:hypothetical protein
MLDDTEATVLCARLEAIVKEVEDVEAQVVAARLFLKEESKATALEQTATVARQCVTRLHLQAAVVLNVRQVVNIVLDSSTNYTS